MKMKKKLLKKGPPSTYYGDNNNTVNCSNMGLPDITWDSIKATILQNFQGHHFILFKNIEMDLFSRRNFTIDRKS